MNENEAEFRARALIAQVKPATLPVAVEAYARHLGAIVRRETDLKPDEPGWSFERNGKHYICVNANDSPERQRFTVCHELAHIHLGLPSEHGTDPSFSHVKRTPNERYCDVFAAELLLPFALFRPLVIQAICGMASIDELARRGEASFPTTGSRFAAFAPMPCAFVFSEAGSVQYASRSTLLREANAWIPPRTPLPKDTASQRARSGDLGEGAEEVDADIWFSDWTRGGILREEARHYSKWDQTLTLLWFEDEEVPIAKPGSRQQEEETGLAELDGVLPWPGRRRRK